MKNSRTIVSLLVLIGLIVSSFIVMYYWNSNSLLEITKVPTQIMILALVYIGLQFLKRTINRKTNWWDWLYYIALTTIALPVFLANESNYSMFSYLVKFGCLFLIIPIFIEGFYMVKQHKA